MACNCGKRGGQRQPLGSTGKGGQSQQEKQREGAKSMTASAFVLEKPNGQTERFTRQLDANAARVRAGGGTIRPIY